MDTEKKPHDLRDDTYPPHTTFTRINDLIAAGQAPRPQEIGVQPNPSVSGKTEIPALVVEG